MTWTRDFFQGKISTDYDPSSSSSVCYAQRKFTAGEQLTIFYGIRANCDLFIHNGFVFPDNQVNNSFLMILHKYLF